MPHSIDNVCSFSIDRSVPCLLVQWHGYATSKQFRQIGESQLRLMTENSLRKVLSDNRDAKIVALEDQQWVAEDWIPRAIAAGYEVCAVITSKDYFAQISLENILLKIGDRLTIQHFDDVEKAKEWLKAYPLREHTLEEGLSAEHSEAPVEE